MADFDAIYREHFTGVYLYILSLCRDEVLAEEIAQEAFFRAMQAMHKFDGRCRLYVWLCQIAKNTYFTYMKKQKRQYTLTEQHSAKETDMEEQLMDHDAAIQLYHFWQTLHEPYKEVFSLRVFSQLRFHQIGARFGKTDSWARLVYYRAKQMLRRRWDEHSL